MKRPQLHELMMSLELDHPARAEYFLLIGARAEEGYALSRWMKRYERMKSIARREALRGQSWQANSFFLGVCFVLLSVVFFLWCAR